MKHAAHDQLGRVASAINALCDCGLRIRPLPPGGPSGDGLLSFASVDAVTVEALRQLTQASRSRVIAIQVAGPPLKPQNHRCWCKLAPTTSCPGWRRRSTRRPEPRRAWCNQRQHIAVMRQQRRDALSHPGAFAQAMHQQPLATRWALRRASCAPAT